MILTRWITSLKADFLYIISKAFKSSYATSLVRWYHTNYIVGTCVILKQTIKPTILNYISL